MPKKSGSQIVQTIQVQLKASADGYRLPTEAEWEYACRAGSTTDFWSGDDTERLRRYAVYGSNKTEAVGDTMCNRRGLSDMHGNVWEWCYDWYAGEQGSLRAFRGGCWVNDAGDCRSGRRYGFLPPYRFYYLGFRVARGPSASKSSSGAESGSR